jgi:hypothetical protein
MSYLARLAARIAPAAAAGGGAPSVAPLAPSLHGGSPLVDHDQRLAMPDIAGALAEGALIGAGLDAAPPPGAAAPGEASLAGEAPSLSPAPSAETAAAPPPPPAPPARA